MIKLLGTEVKNLINIPNEPKSAFPSPSPKRYGV